MNRVLRSLIDYDGKVSQENLRKNYFAFDDAGLEFVLDQDSDVWGYVRAFFNENRESDLPNIQSITDYFEHEGRPDVIDRLHEIRESPHYIRSNFVRLCRDLFKIQQDRKLDALLRETAVIKSSGLKMDKRGPLKKGVRDAVEHFISGADDLLTIDSEGKLKGDVTADGDEVLAEYFAQKASPKIGRLMGINHIDKVTKGLRPGELMILLGFVGELKCVTGDTLVVTDQGLRRIGELCPSEKKPDWFYETTHTVLTKDGWADSSHFYYGGEKEVVTLTSAMGYSVTCTPNHPVYVRTSEGEELFKRADQISGTDFLCIDRQMQAPKVLYYKVAYEYSPRPGAFKDCEIPTVVDEGLGRLLGYYVAEGTCADTGAFSITQNPGEIQDDIKQLTQDYFGVDLHSPYSESNPLRGTHPGDLIYYSKKLRGCFESLGVGYVKSASQCVPHSIFQSPLPVIREFLRGYFEGDGGVPSNGVVASTRSEKLASDIQILLLLFGIISHKYEYVVEGKPNYSIKLRGAEVDLFGERIGFVSDRKMASLTKICGRKRNTNRDIIPGATVLVKEASFEAMAVCPSKGKRACDYRHYDYERGQSLSYAKLKWYRTEIEAAGGSVPSVVQQVLDREYYYDPVQRVEAGIQKVYDFRIPKGANFIGNGIVNHNTSLALNYAYNTSVYYGWNVMYFSLEMKYEVVRQILFCIHSTHDKFRRHSGDKRYIDFGRLRDGELSEDEEALLVEVVADFNDNQGKEYGRLIVERPNGDITVSEIKLKSEVEHRKHDLGLVIIDHAGLIENEKGRSVNNFGVSLNYVLKDLSQFALNFNDGEGIPVCTPFQANRSGWKEACKNNGHYKLDALSWASEAERSASLIIYTFLGDNNELRDNGEVRIGCLKNRGGGHFSPFTASVHFQSRRIRNPIELEPGEVLRELGLDDSVVS